MAPISMYHSGLDGVVVRLLVAVSCDSWSVADIVGSTPACQHFLNRAKKLINFCYLIGQMANWYYTGRFSTQNLIRELVNFHMLLIEFHPRLKFTLLWSHNVVCLLVWNRRQLQCHGH